MALTDDLTAFDAATGDSDGASPFSPYRAAPANPHATSISGQVEKVHYAKPHWSAGTLRTADGLVKFTVKAFVSACDSLTLHGQYTRTEKYGYEFTATRAVHALPDSTDGIVKWLEWNAKGIGAKRAAALVAAFGADLMDVFVGAPERIAAKARVKVEDVRAVAELWTKYESRVRTVSALAALGLTNMQCDAIEKRHGTSSVPFISHDPYALVGSIDGIGWKTADEIAAKVGITGTDPRRLRGGLAALVREEYASGHTATPLPLACARAAELLAAPVERVSAEVDAVVTARHLTRLGTGHDTRDLLATPWAARCERGLWEFFATSRDRNPLRVCREGEEREYAEGYRQCGTLLLDDGQLAAVENAVRYRITTITGSAGSGKAQPLDAKVLTPNGFVLMGSLKVGDVVIGSDGKSCLVTGVYPQGMKPVVRVGFTDGTATECTTDHLWFTTTVEEERKKAPNPGTVKTTSRIAVTLTRTRPSGKVRNFHRAVKCAPVEFVDRGGRPIDSYCLGAMIGDGCFRKHSIGFTSLDVEIIDRINRAMSPLYKLAAQVGSSKDYRLVKTVKFSPSGIKHGVLTNLRWLGLDNCKANSKFVPDQYKYAPTDVRLEFLRGLFDTDGCPDTSTVDYITVSPRLADDVAFMVRSLGGRVSISTKTPTYTHKGEKKEGQLAYRMNVRLPEGVNPFFLARKADKIVAAKRDIAKFFSSVEPAGEKECQCISVSAADGLYVTDDFIVTHNTSVARAVIKSFNDHPRYRDRVYLTAPTGRAARRLTEVIGMPAQTIHKLLQWQGKTANFYHNEENPLPSGLYCADEVSMIDSSLFHHFTQALPSDSALVLIGDTQQLPPVGAGAVLRDILAHDLVPATRLQQCHRHAGALKRNCTALLSGMVAPSVMDGSPPPWVLCDNLDTEQKVLALIWGLYRDYFPRWGFGDREWVFLAPKLDGPLGVRRINLAVQVLAQHARGNMIPKPTEDDWQRRPTFYVGDRVIMTRNVYSLGASGIMNGTVGRVTQTEPDLVVDFEGETVTLEGSDKNDLHLAYCVTAHRFQGSQIPCAVVVIPKGSSGFVGRNWVYTAASRAMQTCVLMGDGDTMRRAAQRTEDDNRRTILSQMAQDEGTR